jgi:hypothetical protein
VSRLKYFRTKSDKLYLLNLEGTLNVSDNIIIHGPNKENHDARLEALPSRLQERNLTLNKQKCEFGKASIKFYGYIFSKGGISQDPEKVTAIKNVERPNNVGELRSCLDMTN